MVPEAQNGLADSYVAINIARMANTYSQIYIQIVFAVQGRQNLIRADRKEELHKYITGIVTRQGQNSLPSIVCPITHMF